MKLLADYHIHSNNCKFKIVKSSIEDIARKANSMGLKEIAITDHGYKHFFASNKQKLLASRKIIKELNSTLDTNVLLGIEADVLSEDGTLDIDNETLANIDVLIIGYHKMIKTDFASYFGRQKNTKEAISSATDAFVNAIKRYDVDIVAHPGAGIKLDLYRLGKTCAEYDVLVEINNRHADFSDDEMKDLIRSGCQFVVSSDSYGVNSVGKVDNALELIKKYEIPSDRVVNVEFFESDKTQLDKEIDSDLERYQKLMDKKTDKSRASELSDETELMLREIAREKGLDDEDNEGILKDYKQLLSDEERLIVERAEEYLKRHKK